MRAQIRWFTLGISLLVGAGGWGVRAYLAKSVTELPVPAVDDLRLSSANADPRPTTWVVATYGSDAGPGDAAQPFRSIQHAADVSLPGDTILIASGSYEGFVVGVAARADAPLTIRGWDRGTTIVAASATHLNAIRITASAAYVTIEGLTATGATASRSAGLLVDSVLGGPVVLRDLRLIDNAGFGVYVFGSRNVTIESSEMSGNGTGVEIKGEGSGVVVHDNDIHDNDLMIRNTPGGKDDYGAAGVAVDKSVGPVLIERNRIWGNRALSYDFGWDGGALELFAASHVTMRENVIWDNENVVETGTDGTLPCSGNSFVRNAATGAATIGGSFGFLLRCGDGMLIAHNSFTDLNSWAILIDTGGQFAGSIQGARFTDNIIALAGQPMAYWLTAGVPASLAIDHNLVWNPGGALARINGVTLAHLADLQTTGYEAGGIEADPRFDPTSGNLLHLATDSPAIDRGVAIDGLVEPYTNAAPDLGWWESPGT